MSFELFIARTWAVLAAALVVYVTSAGIAVAWIYISRWRRGVFQELSSNTWVALTITVLLDVLLFAVLDVGQAFPLVADKWEAVVAICASAIMPIIFYKTRTKVADINKDKED